jgi:GLPGLI family protein
MNIRLGIAGVLLLLTVVGKSQKLFSEGTIVYDVIVKTGSDKPQSADLLDGATQKVFIKGYLSRTEMSSLLGSTTTIYDARSGTAIRLNEYGDQKIMTRLTRENFIDANKKYEGVSFEKTTETKVIAGYKCIKAIGRLKNDTTTFTVYYAEDLVPMNKNYDMQFKGLPGLVLEYEARIGGLQVTFTASKISFDIVPSSKFEAPKSGYRELTYEESKNIR